MEARFARIYSIRSQLNFGVRLHQQALIYDQLVNDDLTIPRALTFGVSDVDPDYVRLDIAAADGHFAGFTEVYGGMDLVADVALRLDGFPSSSDDRREILLGSQDAGAAGGWVRILCRCADRAGHPILEIYLDDKLTSGGAIARSARIHLHVEAPAIDEFVQALKRWKGELGSRITLRGAT